MFGLILVCVSRLCKLCKSIQLKKKCSCNGQLKLDSGRYVYWMQLDSEIPSSDVKDSTTPIDEVLDNTNSSEMILQRESQSTSLSVEGSEVYTFARLGSFFRELSLNLPPFFVCSSHLNFLDGPHNFYRELQNLITTATRRLVLASLYFSGNTNAERLLLKLLRAQLEKMPLLKVYLIFDYNRMKRSGEYAAVFFEELKKSFPDRVYYALFRVPMTPFWVNWVNNKKLREFAGVFHIKMYVSDNTVLWSGANLSEHYFTSRTDRYMKIRDEPDLCDWCLKLAEALWNYAHSQMNGCMDATGSIGSTCTSDSLIKVANLVNTNISLYDVLSPFCRPAPVTSTVTDTVIFPYLQLGTVGLFYDSIVTVRLLQHARTIPSSHAVISSAYFNFTNEVLRTTLQEARNEVHIITSALECNSFHGGTGITRFVPRMYAYLARSFHRIVRDYGQSHRLKLWTWEKADSTYHGKGFWLTLQECAARKYARDSSHDPRNLEAKRHSRCPAMTIGSSNLGKRSEERDLELNILILTANSELQKCFSEERNYIFKRASLIDDVTPLRKPNEHLYSAMKRFFLRPFVALLAELAKSYL